jgi:metal-responsive CopG/Arc/MetJ family transcriptional regulator
MIFNLLVYYIVPHVCKNAFLNQQTYMYIVILYKNSQKKNAQIVTDLQSSCNKVVVKRADEHVKTHKLLQVCKQVVTSLFTSC